MGKDTPKKKISKFGITLISLSALLVASLSVFFSFDFWNKMILVKGVYLINRGKLAQLSTMIISSLILDNSSSLVL